MNHLADVEAEERPQDLGAAVDLGAEDRLALIETAGHAGVLPAEAGEEEDHRADLRLADRGEQAPRVVRRERPGRVAEPVGDQDAAVRHRLATHLEGVRGIGKIEVRLGLEALGQAVGDALQRGR